MVNKTDRIYSQRDSSVWSCSVYTKEIFPFKVIDEGFLETLAELRQSDSLIPFARLIDQKKTFSPFELNQDSNLPLIDSDPDVQFKKMQWYYAFLWLLFGRLF